MSHLFQAAVLNDQRTLCPAARQILHCVVFTYYIKQASEIRKLHAAGVQRRQRSVQKSAMHVQICCFVNKNLLLFYRSLSFAVVVDFVLIQK